MLGTQLQVTGCYHLLYKSNVAEEESDILLVLDQIVDIVAIILLFFAAIYDFETLLRISHPSIYLLLSDVVTTD
jgi:uncharacterized membrane protein HdeD (DUF308 family)